MAHLAHWPEYSLPRRLSDMCHSQHQRVEYLKITLIFPKHTQPSMWLKVVNDILEIISAFFHLSHTINQTYVSGNGSCCECRCVECTRLAIFNNWGENGFRRGRHTTVLLLSISHSAKLRHHIIVVVASISPEKRPMQRSASQARKGTQFLTAKMSLTLWCCFLNFYYHPVQTHSNITVPWCVLKANTLKTRPRKS